MKKIYKLAIIAGCITLTACAGYNAVVKKPINIEIAAAQEAQEPAEVITYYTVIDGNAVLTPNNAHQEYIYRMCKKHGLKGYEKLITAMFYVESSFNPDAVSGTGDIGIAQINEINHERLIDALGVTDFSDPYDSIECGVFMLKEALWQNDFDSNKALVAYNMGQSKVDAGVYTTAYTERVYKIMNALEIHHQGFFF